MSTPALRLDWCNYEAARYAVTHWHYSRSLPTPPLVKIGVWEAGRFIGCVLFSRGATQNIGRPFGLRQTEVAELTRVALAAHAAPVSRIIAIALRLLAKTATLRLVISYADPGHDHHGGIYQAAGWTYLGQGEPSIEYLDGRGRRWHARMVSPSGKKRVYGAYRAVLRPDQCVEVHCPGKHKYALALDAEMRAQLAPLARPYPKPIPSGRASGESDTPAVQAGEGAAMQPHGSMPTVLTA